MEKRAKHSDFVLILTPADNHLQHLIYCKMATLLYRVLLKMKTKSRESQAGVRHDPTLYSFSLKPALGFWPRTLINPTSRSKFSPTHGKISRAEALDSSKENFLFVYFFFSKRLITDAKFICIA